MFTIYNEGGLVVAQCIPGGRAHSGHIGNWASDLLDLVTGWGFAVEFQGQVHFDSTKAKDWHDLPLARAEFVA